MCAAQEENQSTVLTARWIAPMDRPIIRDGGIAFSRGIITAIAPASEIIAAHRDAEVTDLGDALLLPGLVNAHTHLELSDCARSDKAPTSFVDWILDIPNRRSNRGAKLPEVAAHATTIGIEQCLRFGVTCVGDISQECRLTRPVIAKSKLRAVSYGETLGLAKRRYRFDELLEAAIDPTFATDRLRIGLTPHAPYTVDLPGYQQCLDIARERHLPLATHLAENPDERDFLVDHVGGFRQIWEMLGYWAEPVETFRGSPIEFAHAIGLLDYPTLLPHVNYCDDAELDLLSRGNASVVFCPRTHAYFNHPPHRWREMLARGINVAVGTDSCASSPDLNIVDDLRLLRKIAPNVPAPTIWEMATIRAARAIQMEQNVGSLTPGKAADFASFDVSSDDPLEEVLSEEVLPTAWWINGHLSS